MIAGLELPTSGRIFLGGEDVAFKRASERDIAFVFQLFALYPHMNVRRNIGFPLLCQGLRRREIAAKVEETANLLRIDHLLDRPVSGLAGGDRQRVALGRAIVRRPLAFLMDEPLGTLDTEFRDLMCDELRQLHDRIKATTVYVTHDQLEAMSMADLIAVMNHGVVEQLGPPQEMYDRPATMFVADFVGSPAMNLIRISGTLAQGASTIDLEGARIAIPETREAVSGGEFVLGARPEHIRFEDSSSLRGEVFGAEYLGTTQIVTVTTGRGRLKARLPANVKVRAGEQVGLAFVGERLSIFDRRFGPGDPHRASRGSRPWLTSPSADVTKRFRSLTAVDRLSLDIADGEFVVLLGPTGAGKTTTLRLVAGLEKADDGEIWIGGRNVSALEPAVARRHLRLPAIFALSASVASTTTWPFRCALRRAGRPRIEIKARVESVAELLRIPHKLKNRIDAALRWRDAARRHRPGAGARAGDLSHGRAAVVARCQIAWRSAARAEAHTEGAGRHHPLCHA